MSEPRIALVVEGPTDFEVFQAALRAILSGPFILTRLQPEATAPVMGLGWGGVSKWCAAAGGRHAGSLDADPTLAIFDLLVIHVDVDVSHKQYTDYGPDHVAMARAKAWRALPCARPCPPVVDSCLELAKVVESWLAPAVMGAKTVLCLPAQSTGTWLAAAALPPDHSLLVNAECNVKLEAKLEALKLPQRIRKSRSEYCTHAPKVTNNWPRVKSLCSQALAFEQAVQAVVL